MSRGRASTNQTFFAGEAAEDDDAYDYYLMKVTSNGLVTSRSEEMDDCRSYLIRKKLKALTRDINLRLCNTSSQQCIIRPFKYRVADQSELDKNDQYDK